MQNKLEEYKQQNEKQIEKKKKSKTLNPSATRG
jgi:hypothetical protein